MSIPIDASAPVCIGDVLAGKYRVERILGIGGMGIVVAATHVQLGQLVALKFVLPQAMSNPTLVERFVREARAAVRLRSEHVARVVDVGTLDSGAPFIVMEFLDGVDLGTRVETLGPLPVIDAADYVLQACEAVAEAHALGIVHRDLKPKNLFLAKRVDGRALIKVLDFGISKLTGSESEAGEMSLTRTTEVMGSPNYMSPEQLRSARDVDVRTDIWALGVILYELLAGYVPFRAETVTQLCAMVLQDEPRPLPQLRIDVPIELANIVSRCLMKNRRDRYANVGELAVALEPFAGDRGGGAGARIVNVLRGASHVSSMPPPSRIVVTPGTSVSWDATELAPGALTLRRRRIRNGIALGSVVVALAVSVFAGAWLGARSRHGDANLLTAEGRSGLVQPASPSPSEAPSGIALLLGAHTESVPSPAAPSAADPPAVDPPRNLGAATPRRNESAGHLARDGSAKPQTATSAPLASAAILAPTSDAGPKAGGGSTPAPASSSQSDGIPGERR